MTNSLKKWLSRARAAGYTPRCMIDCYRDSSVLQHIGVSVHDAYQAARQGDLLDASRALVQKTNFASIRAVLEELPWLMRF